MTKKNWFLVIVAVGLAAIYIVYFTDWFRPKTIHIFHASRAMNTSRRANADGILPVRFGFDNALQLTSIKVVPVDVLKTNGFPQPVWHLVSDSNSVPIKTFIYGQNIRGMKAAVTGSRPQPLQTNVVYRLFVETAGSAKGEHDFEAKAAN